MMSDPPAARNLAGISLGSNINPVENLQAAVRELSRFGTIKQISRAWESAPVGFLDQANFLNAAVLLETTYSPEELKRDVLDSIERQLQRVRDPRNINAPRTIDLDLSLYITPTESFVLDDDVLARAFVAIPLAEILPEFADPKTGRTLAGIAESFAGPSRDLVPRPDCDLSAGISPML
jgi:2-amino-4-hydroxy-6-hydroxymethyldihydropteridine diphosphokinase